MTPLTSNLLDPKHVDWELLDGFEDRTVFQTREWLNFVAQTQRATPVIAEIRDSGKVVGYFSGLTFTRMGVKILGSSFPGWTTPYMGFNLRPGITRADALAVIEKLAWGVLKCLHMEVSDSCFAPEDGQRLGFQNEFYVSYRTDLTQPEQVLFSSMDSACRRCIRKAEKSGVVIEEAQEAGFAEEYHEQLKDVFRKQGLVPTYDVERVRALVRNLLPTGRILLVRARDPEGRSIATGIFPGFNQIAEFWGNASFRQYQILRPNEAIQWYVMRYWKKRGVKVYDWGGEGTYKEKYGCTAYRVPWFTKSRYPLVSVLRNQARSLYARKQRFLGWLQGEDETERKDHSTVEA